MSNDDPGRNDDDEQYDGTFAEADPEQVARRLHEERRFLGADEPDWDRLSQLDREVGIALIIALFRWLTDEGSEP